MVQQTRRRRSLLLMPVLLGVLAACGGSAAGTDVATSAQPYTLYTHCGIDEARIGDRFFEAEQPLHDGSFNPPPGWDNPFHKGTMTVLSESAAEFTDDEGHAVRFRLRPGATAFKRICS